MTARACLPGLPECVCQRTRRSFSLRTPSIPSQAVGVEAFRGVRIGGGPGIRRIRARAPRSLGRSAVIQTLLDAGSDVNQARARPSLSPLHPPLALAR